MHIMEGFLDPIWCVVWFIIAAPFVFLGAKKIIELIREHPEHKMTIALSGAFIFLLSSLKLPFDFVFNGFKSCMAECLKGRNAILLCDEDCINLIESKIDALKTFDSHVDYIVID